MIRVQLQEMKEKCGLTNKEIADRSGVSLPTVNRIMSGQTDVPNYQTVCDLVMAMGGSLDELAGIKRETVVQHVAFDEGYMAIIKDKDHIIRQKDRWIKDTVSYFAGSDDHPFGVPDLRLSAPHDRIYPKVSKRAP